MAYVKTFCRKSNTVSGGEKNSLLKKCHQTKVAHIRHIFELMSQI